MMMNKAPLITQPKVALFTDIHIGIHKNSPIWHNISLEFCDWFVEQLHKNKITDIIFCGDFYHTRHEIEQTTLDCGVKFLTKLKDFNLIMIPGNHCCYFKHNSDVHSLSPFKEWGNITIFDKPTFVEVFGKKLAFCPWGTALSDIPISDYVFGHFELVNFKMNSFKVCEHGDNSEDLLRNCNNVFSGHFHLRDCKQYENNKTITYLGSPFEMDFGERDQSKGVTILDLNSGKTQFIENDISPRHKKISLTQLVETPSLLNSLKENIKSNFVSVVIDKSIPTDVLEKIQTKFTFWDPLEIRFEHTLTHLGQIQQTEFESVGIDILSTIQEYVDTLDIKLSKTTVYKKITDFYEKALLKT